MNERRHPTLDDETPKFFWEALETDIADTLRYQEASLYFKVFGWVDNGITPSKWRDVLWTITDFAYFYHCPESRDAFARFRYDYLYQHPLEASPSWQEVVNAMDRVVTDPEHLPDYLNLRRAHEIDKSTWVKEDYWVAYILRLLQYRKKIEKGHPADMDEFEARVYYYSRTVGYENPFYYEWDASDRWAAAYLLYAKLSYERDLFSANYLEEHPEEALPEDVHPAARDVVEEREERERERREQARANFRNHLINRHHLQATLRYVLSWH
ncbi:hypothetical protein F4776DRAFT_560312 [Hypoxylon sp. NC0597]|nr:hypothetical protein F4776DRAFT_560312 [Hypoxylon sp. NC0597]